MRALRASCEFAQQIRMSQLAICSLVQAVNCLHRNLRKTHNLQRRRSLARTPPPCRQKGITTRSLQASAELYTFRCRYLHQATGVELRTIAAMRQITLAISQIHPAGYQPFPAALCAGSYDCNLQRWGSGVRRLHRTLAAT